MQAVAVLAGLAVGLAALAALSPARLDDLPGLCLWSRLTGRPCPACGTTHALCALLHGDWRGAWGCNRNVVLVAPALVLVAFEQGRLLWRCWRRRPPPPGASPPQA